MSTTTNATSEHYTQGNLISAIEQAYTAAGVDFSKLTTSDLTTVDEFHIGGLVATEYLANHLGLTADAKVLDIGCGIGGPARYMAEQFGCQVHGVDLTTEYVETGNALSERVGLADKVQLEQANALSLPVADASIDAAYMIHVGMNIEDKTALLKEAYRALKPGGRFGIYDILSISDASFDYPMPWAGSSDISFVSAAAAYREAATAVGFQVQQDESRGAFAKAFFAKQRERSGPPAGPGLGLVMGVDFGRKIQNLAKAVTTDVLAPWQFIFVK